MAPKEPRAKNIHPKTLHAYRQPTDLIKLSDIVAKTAAPTPAPEDTMAIASVRRFK